VIRASAAQRIAVEPIELPLKEEKKYPPKPVTWPGEIDGFLIELLPGILFEAVTGGRCHRRIIHFRGISSSVRGPFAEVGLLLRVPQWDRLMNLT